MENSNSMDRLDRFSIWAIVILLISSFALISYHLGEARPVRNGQQRVTAVTSAANSEVEGKCKVIRNIIEGGNLGKAEVFVREVIQRYPYEGEPRMLMGDIYIRRQELIKAVLEYKEAVDLNPDYLDKKTPLFQGKKLKGAVKEALDEIEKKIKANNDDEAMRQNRKVIYYLQRRIAGSCG